jgi:hypothetical protein
MLQDTIKWSKTRILMCFFSGSLHPQISMFLPRSALSVRVYNSSLHALMHVVYTAGEVEFITSAIFDAVRLIEVCDLQTSTIWVHTRLMRPFPHVDVAKASVDDVELICSSPTRVFVVDRLRILSSASRFRLVSFFFFFTLCFADQYYSRSASRSLFPLIILLGAVWLDDGLEIA